MLDNRIVTTSHTPHPCIRNIANLHFTDALNQLQGFLRTSDPTIPAVIIDIGAKYASLEPTIQLMARDMAKRVIYVAIRPNTDEYDRAYHAQHSRNWPSLTDTDAEVGAGRRDYTNSLNSYSHDSYDSGSYYSKADSNSYEVYVRRPELVPQLADVSHEIQEMRPPETESARDRRLGNDQPPAPRDPRPEFRELHHPAFPREVEPSQAGNVSARSSANILTPDHSHTNLAVSHLYERSDFGDASILNLLDLHDDFAELRTLTQLQPQDRTFDTAERTQFVARHLDGIMNEALAILHPLETARTQLCHGTIPHPERATPIDLDHILVSEEQVVLRALMTRAQIRTTMTRQAALEILRKPSATGDSLLAAAFSSCNAIQTAEFKLSRDKYLYKGTLQDFYQSDDWRCLLLHMKAWGQSENDIHNLSLDSGYYLSDVNIRGHLFLAIMEFPTLIGTYTLPAHEGFVKVSARFPQQPQATSRIEQQISMWTQGTTRRYEHPNVVFTEPNDCFDFLGIRWVAAYSPPRSSPRFKTIAYPLAMYSPRIQEITPGATLKTRYDYNVEIVNWLEVTSRLNVQANASITSLLLETGLAGRKLELVVPAEVRLGQKINLVHINANNLKDVNFHPQVLRKLCRFSPNGSIKIESPFAVTNTLCPYAATPDFFSTQRLRAFIDGFYSGTYLSGVVPEQSYVVGGVLQKKDPKVRTVQDLIDLTALTPHVTLKYIDHSKDFSGQMLAEKPREQSAIQSGFMFTDKPFSFDPGLLSNQIFSAYGRLFSARVIPDPIVQESFREFCETTRLSVRTSFEQVIIPPKSIQDWIQDHGSAWSKSKKTTTLSTCMNQIQEPHNTDHWKIEFEVLVKGGEIFTTKEICLDSEGYILDVPERPRCIANPVNTAKGLFAYANYWYIQWAKRCVPGFIHGMTSTQLRDYLRTYLQYMSDRLPLSTDYKAYDATQHKFQQNCVDNMLIHEGFASFTKWMRDSNPELEIDQATLDKLLRGLVKLSRTLKVPDLQSRSHRALLKFEIQGTTLSGNPISTTFGNTMRSVYYNEFELWSQDRTRKLEFGTSTQRQGELHIYAGDDRVSWIRREDMHLRIKTLEAYNARKQEAVIFGLGNVIDEITVGRAWHDFTFCSLYAYGTGNALEDDFILIKNPANAMHNSNVYSGSNLAMKKDPPLHAQAVARCLQKTYGGVLIDTYANALVRGQPRPYASMDNELYHLGSMPITSLMQEKFVIEKYMELTGFTPVQTLEIIHRLQTWKPGEPRQLDITETSQRVMQPALVGSARASPPFRGVIKSNSIEMQPINNSSLSRSLKTPKSVKNPVPVTKTILKSKDWAKKEPEWIKKDALPGLKGPMNAEKQKGRRHKQNKGPSPASDMFSARTTDIAIQAKLSARTYAELDAVGKLIPGHLTYPPMLDNGEPAQYKTVPANGFSGLACPAGYTQILVIVCPAWGALVQSSGIAQVIFQEGLGTDRFFINTATPPTGFASWGDLTFSALYGTLPGVPGWSADVRPVAIQAEIGFQMPEATVSGYAWQGQLTLGQLVKASATEPITIDQLKQLADKMQPLTHQGTLLGRASIEHSALFMEAIPATRDAIKTDPAIALDDEMAYFCLIEKPSQSLTTVSNRDCVMNLAVRTDLYLTPVANSVAIGTVINDATEMQVGSKLANQRLLCATRRWECVNYLQYLNKKRPNRRRPLPSAKGNSSLKAPMLQGTLTDLVNTASGYLGTALDSDVFKHIERVLREVATGSWPAVVKSGLEWAGSMLETYIPLPDMVTTHGYLQLAVENLDRATTFNQTPEFITAVNAMLEVLSKATPWNWKLIRLNAKRLGLLESRYQTRSSEEFQLAQREAEENHWAREVATPTLMQMDADEVALGMDDTIEPLPLSPQEQRQLEFNRRQTAILDWLYTTPLDMPNRAQLIHAHQHRRIPTSGTAVFTYPADPRPQP